MQFRFVAITFGAIARLNTAPGFDGMTGIGTVGKQFIKWMAAA